MVLLRFTLWGVLWWVLVDRRRMVCAMLPATRHGAGVPNSLGELDVVDRAIPMEEPRRIRDTRAPIGRNDARGKCRQDYR